MNESGTNKSTQLFANFSDVSDCSKAKGTDLKPSSLQQRVNASY
jgi:hypothetical protein